MPTRARILFVALLVLAAPAAAQPRVVSQANAERQLAMEVGETRLLRLSEKIVRVSIADPNVVDVRVVTPLQVLVTSKGVGYTHLVLWSETDQPLVIAVNSRRNLSDLRGQLKELFPSEKVKVSSAGDLVVLSGTVSDLRLPSRLAEVAKLHAKSLANLIEVSGDQQVQLEVRFAEVSRNGLRKIGLGMLWQDSARGYVGGITPAGATAGAYLNVPGTGAANGPPAVMAPMAGDAFSLIFSTGLSQFPFSAVLSILAQEGLAKMLAEPTLVALNGQDAAFHAGGEVPILVAQSFGQVTVQYKKFGVQLKFVPTVLGDKNMSLKVFAEVSEPDFTVGVNLGGFQVPGFKSRSSETTVRLRDGQSFAVAGLLSNSIRSVIKKVPLLGEIPVLGALFRSTSYQREESELLVVVKAHLVRPLSPEEVPTLPGAGTIDDPDDFQLFMLGRVEGGKRKTEKKSGNSNQKQSGAGGPVGPVGFLRD